MCFGLFKHKKNQKEVIETPPTVRDILKVKVEDNIEEVKCYTNAFVYKIYEEWMKSINTNCRNLFMDSEENFIGNPNYTFEVHVTTDTEITKRAIAAAIEEIIVYHPDITYRESPTKSTNTIIFDYKNCLDDPLPYVDCKLMSEWNKKRNQ